MLTFKLISIIDGFYHYEIYPEKNIEKKTNFNFQSEIKRSKDKYF